jgi:hypothetical protein
MRTPLTTPGFDNFTTIIEVEPVAVKYDNDSTEQTIYSVTIPPRTLGVDDRAVHVKMPYLAFNNSGAVREIQWRCYYGDSATPSMSVDQWSDSAGLRGGCFEVWLSNKGAYNLQDLFAQDMSANHVCGNLEIAEDSFAELDLDITIQFNFAHVNLWLQRQMVVVSQYSP